MTAPASARALYFDAPHVVSVRTIALRPPAADEVIVRGLASAISEGTELLLYRGEGPAAFDPSIGAGTFPLRYGYAWVGRREDTGARVFGLLPHGDPHVVATSSLRSMREDIPASRATLAANLETAITCVWDAHAAFGERIVVLGGGVVGILCAWLFFRSGARVELVEPRAARRAAAAKLFPSIAIGRGTADVVVEATGDPRALDDAIAWSAPEARIVVASFYGQRRAPVDLGDAFHRRRLTLRASQVSAIPSLLAARWTLARRFELVRELLAEPSLDALIAPPVPFDDAPALYARLAARDEDDAPPCHVFEYS